ncbi:hypothetical protein ACLBX9_28810 [Methylobacterium sp. A49B]
MPPVETPPVEAMTPQTTIGWILFVIMWVAGPITGYTSSSLIASVLERKSVKRRDAITFALFGSLLTVSTLVLISVVGL